MMRIPDHNIPVVHRRGEPFHGEVVFSPNDISYGIYILGMPGSGKSSLSENIWTGFNDWAEATGEDVALIAIDPKGDVAGQFLERTPHNANLLYVDPGPTGTRLSMNMLALPHYTSPDDRERVVLTTKGFAIDALGALVGFISEQTPQLRRVLNDALGALYAKDDKPSIRKLNSLLIGLQNKDPRVLKWLNERLSAPEYQALLQDITSLSGMEAAMFVSTQNRTNRLSTDNLLARTLSSVDDNVDFQEMLKGGRRTIVRLSKNSLGEHLPLIMGVIVMKILSAVEERAQNVPEEERTPVLLILDEFQIIQSIQAIWDALALFRQYKLGLALIHQGTGQLDDDHFDIIMETVHTQIVGKCDGKDAERIASHWEIDNDLRKKLAEKLKHQKEFEWAFRIRQSAGDSSPFDFYFKRARPPIQPLYSREECEQFKQTMRERLGSGEPDTPLFVTKAEDKWQEEYLPKWVEIPTQKEGRVLIALKEQGSLSFYKLTELLGMRRGEGYDQFYYEMRDKGLITIEARANSHYCSLGELGKKLVYPDFWTNPETKVVKSEDGRQIAQAVVDYWQSRLCFIYPAVQMRGGKLIKAPDFIVYDYQAQEAFAVEVESNKEGDSHGEQVTINLSKYYEQEAATGLKRLEEVGRLEMKEHIQYLVDEFLRDKEAFKDKIKAVAVEELGKPQPGQKQPEEAAPGTERTAGEMTGKEENDLMKRYLTPV